MTAVADSAAPSAETNIIELPLLTHRGAHSTRARETVYGVDGRPLASLSLAPDLLVSQTLLAQRRAASLPAHERAERLAEASRRFLDDRLGGLSFAEHCRHVNRVSGHNVPLTERMSRAVAVAIAEAPSRADRARPNGSLRSWREVTEGAGSGIWVRRGETLAAVLSGNAPTIQSGWLQALALGYRVAVRPSRREPFTAHRTVLALRAAGFPATSAVCLPSTHAGVPTLLRRAELALAYGGDDIASRYGTSPNVKVAGPGRSKTLVTRDHVSSGTVDVVAHSVAALSGAACVNTTAVLVEGDHLRFARDLAGTLTAQADGLRTTEGHLGPRVRQETADALIGYLERNASRAHAEIPLKEVVTPHPDGGVVLGPAVFTVTDPYDSLLAAELPFPCVWVAPWSRADGVGPLRDSLIVNAITGDTDLVAALLSEPGVGNVYVNTPTTHSDGNLPHEDYIGDFLMRNKAVARDLAPRDAERAGR